MTSPVTLGQCGLSLLGYCGLLLLVQCGLLLLGHCGLSLLSRNLTQFCQPWILPAFWRHLDVLALADNLRIALTTAPNNVSQGEARHAGLHCLSAKTGGQWSSQW